MNRRKTENALALTWRDVGTNDAFRSTVEQKNVNARIARRIYRARSKADQTQVRLADLVGAGQSVNESPASRFLVRHPLR